MDEITKYLDELQAIADNMPASDLDPKESLEAVLKGRSVELCLKNGDRLFLLADEEDVRLLGELRGSIYTGAEIRRIVAIGDPAVVARVHQYKRSLDATVSEIERNM